MDNDNGKERKDASGGRSSRQRRLSQGDVPHVSAGTSNATGTTQQQAPKASLSRAPSQQPVTRNAPAASNGNGGTRPPLRTEESMRRKQGSGGVITSDVQRQQQQQHQDDRTRGEPSSASTVRPNHNQNQTDRPNHNNGPALSRNTSFIHSPKDMKSSNGAARGGGGGADRQPPSRGASGHESVNTAAARITTHSKQTTGATVPASPSTDYHSGDEMEDDLGRRTVMGDSRSRRFLRSRSGDVEEGYGSEALGLHQPRPSAGNPRIQMPEPVQTNQPGRNPHRHDTIIDSPVVQPSSRSYDSVSFRRAIS
jgi:hypothetical protein